MFSMAVAVLNPTAGKYFNLEEDLSSKDVHSDSPSHNWLTCLGGDNDFFIGHAFPDNIESHRSPMGS